MNKLKYLLITSVIIAAIFLSACDFRPKCGDVRYDVNISHCVKNCDDDCYGNTICGKGTDGCYASHCYGFYFNNQYYSNSCTEGSWFCDRGHYYCTATIRTFEQDRIDAENSRLAAIEAGKKLNSIKSCYNNGSSYEYEFDIITDYNLSCTRIAYINDHLIDSSRQVDGGYISGSYSGFISHGHVEGHLYQYVTEGVLATGQLVRNAKYHLDCNNGTKDIDGFETKKLTYYSESDFVNYYVNKCITD